MICNQINLLIFGGGVYSAYENLSKQANAKGPRWDSAVCKRMPSPPQIKLAHPPLTLHACTDSP